MNPLGKHDWATPSLREQPLFITKYPIDDADTGSAEARILRLEKILREEGPYPYILVRLAQELQYYKDAHGSALRYFEEARAQLAANDDPDDEVLVELISAQEKMVDAIAQRDMALNADTIAQWSQLWNPTADLPFPHHLLDLPPGHQLIKQRWKARFLLNPVKRARYLTSLAIQTNHVDDVFLLTKESIKDLLTLGVYSATISADPKSKLGDPKVIRRIIIDTLKAFELAYDIDITNVTPESICDVHQRLLDTDRFYHAGEGGPGGYQSPGDTRSTTRYTAYMANSSEAIQFCPFDEVDDELEVICDRAKIHLANTSNPFASASWIHLVLVCCHPFNDGNGRLARIIASLPLLKAGYPPITISLLNREAYHDAIRKGYKGDHSAMIECLLEGMRAATERAEDAKP